MASTVIKYKTATNRILPDCIDIELKELYKKIIDNRYEPDKQHCNISNFKGFLIKWFAEHQVTEEELRSK